MKSFFSRELLVIGAVLTLAAVFAFQAVITQRRTRGESLLKRHADAALAACASDPYRPSCYDREIPKLAAALSLEDTFKVTKLVQERDSGYFYCHVLGHELSSREVRKNPARWKEVISRCPGGMCSNGCIHGAFQERFRADALSRAEIEEIKPDLETICEARQNWRPTGLEQNTCYHALGHLLMYITSADTPKATELCNDVALKRDGRSFLQFCYDGVFMQIFQPLEPEDFALVKDVGPKKKEGLLAFCDTSSGEARESCWREGWPLYAEEVRTPEGLIQFCSIPDGAEAQNKCYNSLFYVLTAQFNFDEAKINTLCSGLPPELKGRCYANAASRFIETDYGLIDKSLRLCELASASGAGSGCYDELVFYSTFNFHRGSAESLRLCSSLPEPWKGTCVRQSESSQ